MRIDKLEKISTRAYRLSGVMNAVLKEFDKVEEKEKNNEFYELTKEQVTQFLISNLREQLKELDDILLNNK